MAFKGKCLLKENNLKLERPTFTLNQISYKAMIAMDMLKEHEVIALENNDSIFKAFL